MGLLRLPGLVALFSVLAWCQPSGITYSETLPILVAGNTTSGFVSAITRDNPGNVYIVGETESASLPVTPGAPQTALTGAVCTDPTTNPLLPPMQHPCLEPFVIELDPEGKVLFGTYLSGAMGLTVDTLGNIYYSGTITIDPLAGGSGGVGAVITKYNPKAGIVYSFVIPGIGGGLLMTADVQGNVYFAGDAVGFTPTSGAFSGKGKIAAGKLNAAGSHLTYGALLGGTTGVSGDTVSSLAVDAVGNLYLTGGTSSSDFPVTPGAFQTQPPNHMLWAFVSKLNPSGGLAWSSFLGGSQLDNSSQIRVDAQGEPYVLGLAESKDFPVTSGAFQTSNTDIGNTGFLTKFTADGSGLVFSTYLDGAFGGTGQSDSFFSAGAFDVDAAGDTFVAGRSSGGFPVTKGATQSCMAGGLRDAFIAQFTPQGAPAAGTYLGGSGIDSAQAIVANSDGTVTVAGNTQSTDFPITTGSEPGINYYVARLQIADPSRPDNPCMTLALENAASRIQKAIAPGELVTVTGNHFGPDSGVTAAPDANGNFPTELAGVRVLFDGVPVPLLYVQSQQINAQAPFELAGKTSAAVHVEYQGMASQTAPIDVRDAAPDFFQTQPAPQGVIFNQDGTPNSPTNPAPVGSVVWILGTGGGLYSPPLPTGSLAPLAPLSKLVLTPTILIDDGVPAEVQYAGSSPTAPSGVFQINFVVPPVATPLPLHTVDVAFGPLMTNPLQTVSIAIK